jgi:hypothetical protein
LILAGGVSHFGDSYQVVGQGSIIAPGKAPMWNFSSSRIGMPSVSNFNRESKPVTK